jgi:hypothetical protein
MKKKEIKKLHEQLEVAQRRHAQRVAKTMEVFLLQDDGTEEAALNEEVSFDKYMDMFEEDQTAAARHRLMLEADESDASKINKKHREHHSAARIRYK